jgi:isocitrate dehydrogenase
MTRDLGRLVGPERKWMNTQDFLAKLDENLKQAMS